jgi:dTDP-4-amino-4,6-dideoxygalactose transaminase
MTDIHASLGISQLKKIDKFIETRNNIAARYNQELLELPISLPTIAEGNKSSYHLYVIKIQDDFAKVKPRDQIYKELIQKGVGVNLHYLPVHLHPYYKNLGFYKNQYPISENYADNALSIPIFYGLTNDQQSKVIQALKIIIK